MRASIVGLIASLLFGSLSGCAHTPPDLGDRPHLIVLGVAQDAGVPQIGTDHPAFRDPDLVRTATCVGLVAGDQRWLVEATPDIKWQLYRLHQFAPPKSRPGLDGVFITHGHIGHYTGLMMLGHEAMGAHDIPVYAMPRMAQFLRTNGPWSQLVGKKNIELRELTAGAPVALRNDLSVEPFLVPHRQEFSEVVGFRIRGPEKTVLFLPDIDSWEEWDEAGTRLEEVLATVDIAFLDATFFANGEIPGRDMSGFPHPFIVKTMDRLGSLPDSERAKVHFLHFNHTNPVLDPKSAAAKEVRRRGFRLAEEGLWFPL